MNKKPVPFIFLLLGISVFLISWGVTGHRTIGRIAENHLSEQAKAAIRDLLGGATLADVSTWADEVRNQADYRHTAPWHFVNLPLGLSYAQLQQQVAGMTQENAYSALLKEENDLANPATPRDAKAEALKFIVHFVGDIHQPMHISRAEDKGGNTIQLNYEGMGTNLHSLWDTKLLEHAGLSYDQLADQYDHPTPAQVKQWQNDPLMLWIWESYTISSRLYAEVDAMKSRVIDDGYYQLHMPIIQDRIEKAGVRLAGVLNTIFKNGPVGEKGVPATMPATTAPPAAAGARTVDIKDVASHVDENVRVCARVYGYKVLHGMVLVNLGADYPDQLLTVVLRDDAMNMYNGLEGQTICVTGTVVMYKDKPEIIVTDQKRLELTPKP